MSDLDKFLKRYSPAVRKIARAAVRVARKSTPGATEKVYFGWRNVMYSYGSMKRFICAVGPQRTYVNLYFMHGPKLKDPAQLLEGTGKNMRHVKIRTLTEARNPRLGRLIRQSAKIAQEK